MKKLLVFLCGVLTLSLSAAIIDFTAFPAHPRLFVGRDGFAPVKADESPLALKLKAKILSEAEALLPVKPVVRVVSGRRMLDVSRQAVRRMLVLALAYRLTDDARFLDRARAELASVCAFTDWNPSHFLDTGEMMFAVGVGYDWLYDAIPEAERATIRTALLEKGLKSHGSSSWMDYENNWNLVCHAGYLAAALTVADEEPVLAAPYIANAVKLMPRAVAAYRDGNFPEGPGYWYYATEYLSVAIAMLESACGTTYGIDRVDGISAQTKYLDTLTGPTGLFFSFSDAGSNPDKYPRGFDFASFYFAKRYGDTASLLTYEIPALERFCGQPSVGDSRDDGSRHFPLTLLYLPAADSIAAARSAKRPLSRAIRGENHVASVRERWDDPNAAFVAVKGGGSLYSHAHKDGGNFVFERDGVRWFTDLGCEDYGRLESEGLQIWGGADDSDRWKLFRYATGGHSVIQIDGREQCGGPGNGRLVRPTVEEQAAGAAFDTVELDLSSLYTNVAESVTRTVSLKGRDLVVEDAVKTRPGAVVTWHGIVRAAATPEGRKVTLSSAGKTLVLEANADWKVEDVSAPAHPYELPNPGVVRLSLTTVAPDSGLVSFVVKSR